MNKTRYFVGFDNSGHRYIVPADFRHDWAQWCELPEDDEASWEVPEHIEAIRIDGAYFTFCEPTIYS